MQQSLSGWFGGEETSAPPPPTAAPLPAPLPVPAGPAASEEPAPAAAPPAEPLPELGAAAPIVEPPATEPPADQPQPAQDLPPLTPLVGDPQAVQATQEGSVGVTDLQPPPAPPESVAPPETAPPEPVATEPEPEPAKVETLPIEPEPKAPPAETASLPPLESTPQLPQSREGVPDVQIIFRQTETAVPLVVQDQLKGLAQQLTKNEALRVTVIAYASGTTEQASTARRVSLSRALAVRAFLIDQGVNNLRINVQAAGNKNPGGEADRVDIFLRGGEPSAGGGNAG